MHPYIPHLLEDIANAHRPENGPKQPEKDVSFEEEMEAIERWAEGNEPIHSFGYYCSLEAVNFPPAAQLSENEVQLINYAFVQMMFSWNLGINLPKNMPPHIQYGYIVDTLNKKTDIVNSGTMCFGFCTGYAPACELKEYCPRLEYWRDWKPETDECGEVKGDEADQPF